MNPGTLIYFKDDESFIYPNNVGLYLDNNQILVPSYLEGWSIIEISETNSFSLFEEPEFNNIKKTYYNENGEIEGIDYLAYNGEKTIQLNLRKIKDIWVITNEFSPPTWNK